MGPFSPMAKPLFFNSRGVVKPTVWSVPQVKKAKDWSLEVSSMWWTSSMPLKIKNSWSDAATLKSTMKKLETCYPRTLNAKEIWRNLLTKVKYLFLGVFIKDLNMMVCKNIQEMDNYMAIGNKSRSTGATLMNADSSRSHSIFTCYIECS